MSLLRAFGRLYAVETLDVRLASTSKSSDGAQSKQPRGNRSTSDDKYNGASPSRWHSPEYVYHGLVFAFVIPWMFYKNYDVSQRTSMRAALMIEPLLIECHSLESKLS